MDARLHAIVCVRNASKGFRGLEKKFARNIIPKDERELLIS